MKKIREEQGITLIALIISIIIMVILAVVSINSIYNMGIVQKAQEGVQQYAQRAVEENEMLDNIVKLIDETIENNKQAAEGTETQKELVAPTITLSGTQGNNGWYKGNVTVTITDTATSENTAATKIKYSVTGANAIAETIVNGRTTTFTISTDGTSNITAYAVDSKNSTSTSATQEVKKDAAVPSTASISVTSTDQTTIAVTGTGADATSGVASYEFEISTTSSTTGFTTPANGTIATTNGSTTYTYTGLTAGTTYYVRVKVNDAAGNVTTSTAATQATTAAVAEEITFTIEGTTYTAIAGMTWEQWIATEYNNSDSPYYPVVALPKYQLGHVGFRLNDFQAYVIRICGKWVSTGC